MRAGLAVIKRNCTIKENPKQIRTPHVSPEQNSAENEAQELNKYQTDSKEDVNNLTSNLLQFNKSKTFTMPNNSQFAQKWQQFQNALQQFTRDLIERVHQNRRTV
jgi:maltose-binding protein MalE